MLSSRPVTRRTSVTAAVIVVVSAVFAMVGLPRLEAAMDPWERAETARYYHSIVGSVLAPPGWDVNRAAAAHGQPTFRSGDVTASVMTVLWDGTSSALTDRVVEWFADPQAIVTEEPEGVSIVYPSDRPDTAIWVRQWGEAAILMHVRGDPREQEALYTELTYIVVTLYVDDFARPQELAS